jgi:ubiquinone/menaquinone biosynthesis C-methylase UbiE
MEKDALNTGSPKSRETFWGVNNAERFSGFADIYDGARPAMPVFPVEIITRYLGIKPDKVVDLGCGSGLSTMVWDGRCGKALGMDPNDDMLAAAMKKQTKSISFTKGYSHDTGLEDVSVDVVVCSQSFHWMEPKATLYEVARILKMGGVFAAVDCDWPPVCVWKAEKAYIELSKKVEALEKTDDALNERFIKWGKEKHLSNIINSGFFRFAREIVFSNRESCSAERFIGLALSQGSLQNILKIKFEAIDNDINAFKDAVYSALDGRDAQVDFCYRMRIGIK